MTDKPERKKRTPKNYDSILAGAMKLELSDKVKLVVELKKDIQTTVNLADDVAKKAKELVNGL